MSNNLGKNQTIAKNTLFLYLRMAIVLIVSLYTTRVVIKSLGVEDYGIYNVVCGFVAMFSFLNTTLSGSINRFYNFEIGKNSNEGVNNIYNCAIRIQVILSVLLFIIIEVVGVWYINTKMVIPEGRLAVANWIFQFSVISLVMTILQSPYIAAILAYESMGYYALVNVVDVFLKLIIAFIVAFIPTDRLWIYGLLIMLISALNLLLYGGYVKTRYKNLFLTRHFEKRTFKSMMSFSAWSFLNPLAYTGRVQGCNIVLNYYFGPIANAAFAITNQVASGIDSFIGSVSVASRPQLIQTYSNGEYSRSEKLFFSTSKIMFVMIAVIVLPISFNIDYLLKIWIGETVPEYTSQFCIWIMAVKLVDSLNPSVTNLIMATGKIKKYMIASSSLILLIIPLSILCFAYDSSPYFMFGVMLLCTCLNHVASIIILHSAFPVISRIKYVREILLSCIPLPLLQSLLLYSINKSVNNPSLGTFLLGFVVSSIFVITYSGLFIFNKTEKQVVKKMIFKH